MAAVALEKEGFRAALNSNGDGTFSPFTHDLAGGAGVADQGYEIQGFRIQLHDNGDGTFAFTTTTSTGPNDVVIELEGFRMKLHPTGANDPITKQPMYAIVVNPV